MNKKRRDSIRYAARLLEEASGIVDKCKDEEEDSISNLEGTALENTDRFSQMEESLSYLEEAYDDIESAKDKLMSAVC